MKTVDEILVDTGMVIKSKEEGQYELNLYNLNSNQIDFFRSLPTFCALKENCTFNPPMIKFTGYDEFDTIKPIYDEKNNVIIKWNEDNERLFVLNFFYDLYEPLDYKGKYYYFKPLCKELVIEKYEQIIKEHYNNVKDIKTMFDFTIQQRNLMELDFQYCFNFKLKMKEDNLKELEYIKKKGIISELEFKILIDIAESVPNRQTSMLYKKFENSISYQEYLDTLFDLEKKCFINCFTSMGV